MTPGQELALGLIFVIVIIQWAIPKNGESDSKLVRIWKAATTGASAGTTMSDNSSSSNSGPPPNATGNPVFGGGGHGSMQS